MDKTLTLAPALPRKVGPFPNAPLARPAAWAPWPARITELPPPDSQAAAVLWQHAVHDVRGKLGVVANITLLLQRPATDERRTALVEMLGRNVTSLGQLLDGVADLAHLQAGVECPVLRPTNAAAALQGVCDSVMALAHTRGLQVEYRGPAVLPVDTDPLMLERIAQNLMLNAVRYTGSRGVLLTCGTSDRAAAGRWFFDVRDVTPAQAVALATDLPQAWVRPVAAQPLPSGEGLGLAIVARLSRLLGAEVETVSTGVGRWTRVSLPRRTGHTLAALLGSAPRAPRGSRSCRAPRP